MSLMQRFKAWLAFHGYDGEDRKEAERLATMVKTQTALITTLNQQNQLLKEENEQLRGQVMEYHARLRNITKKLTTALEKQ